MKWFQSTLLLCSLILTGCRTNPDEIKVQFISKEMEQIISQKEQIAREIKSQPPVFSKENVENYPNNRSQLEPIAKEQIRLFNEMIRLDEMEIEKLQQAELLKLEPDFRQFVKLMKQTQEKTVELSKLRIQNFQLISDNAVSSSQQLEERFSINNQKQSNLQLEISQLEEQREKIRINR